MPDSWESANGLNPAVNDANLDPDDDSLTNYQEYLAGTDPHDVRSRLRLAAVGVGGQVQLSFMAVAGRTYGVLACDALGQGEWSPLQRLSAEANDRVVTVMVPVDTPQRLFQLTTPW